MSLPIISGSESRIVPSGGMSRPRNPQQEALANKVKGVSAVAAQGVCLAVNLGLKTVAENSCPEVPKFAKQMLVDAATTKGQEVTTNLCNEMIDSNCCYGDEKSRVSVLTQRLLNSFQKSKKG